MYVPLLPSSVWGSLGTNHVVASNDANSTSAECASGRVNVQLTCTGNVMSSRYPHAVQSLLRSGHDATRTAVSLANSTVSRNTVAPLSMSGRSSTSKNTSSDSGQIRNRSHERWPAAAHSRFAASPALPIAAVRPLIPNNQCCSFFLGWRGKARGKRTPTVWHAARRLPFRDRSAAVRM